MEQSKNQLFDTFRELIQTSTDRNLLLAVKYSDFREIATRRLEEVVTLGKATTQKNPNGDSPRAGQLSGDVHNKETKTKILLAPQSGTDSNKISNSVDSDVAHRKHIETVVKDTMLAMLAGDALSAPLHWYYNHEALKSHVQTYYSKIEGAVNEFGKLQRAVGIPDMLRLKHPNSWNYFKKIDGNDLAKLNLLHGTESVKRWNTPGMHYHATMKAGGNTTTSVIALLLMEHLTKNTRYMSKKYLHEFEIFFETPKKRNDMYVSEVHRHYFRKKAEGVPMHERGAHEECASAMTLFIPLLAFLSGVGSRVVSAEGDKKEIELSRVLKQICNHIRLHHNTEKVVEQTIQISQLLLNLWNLPRPSLIASLSTSSDSTTPRDKEQIRTDRVKQFISSTFDWFFMEMKSNRQYANPSVEFFANMSPEDLFLGKDAYALAGQPGSAHFSLR